MKTKIFPFVTIVTIFFLAISCYYDNEEALYPTLGGNCDTLNISFSKNIAPMLANNCLSCHSNTTAAVAGGNIKLQDYADVKLLAASVAGSIKHTGAYSPMPKNGGMLSDCLITQFDKWVAGGYLQN